MVWCWFARLSMTPTCADWWWSIPSRDRSSGSGSAVPIPASSLFVWWTCVHRERASPFSEMPRTIWAEPWSTARVMIMPMSFWFPLPASLSGSITWGRDSAQVNWRLRISAGTVTRISFCSPPATQPMFPTSSQSGTGGKTGLWPRCAARPCSGAWWWLMVRDRAPTG